MLEALASGGLAGLLSALHCAAMCGPLCAAVCTARPSRFVALRYQLGRMLGYAFAGSLAARVGQLVGRSLAEASPLVFGVVAAFAFAALALSAARVAFGRPSGARLASSAPALVQLSSRDGRASSASWSSVWRALLRVLPREPVVYGALSVFLPCGALAAALLLAAASASPLHGSALMLAFACTSGLGVLGAGAIVAKLSGLGARVVPRVLVFALSLAAVLSVTFPLYRAYAAASAPSAQPASACH